MEDLFCNLQGVKFYTYWHLPKGTGKQVLKLNNIYHPLSAIRSFR